MRLVCVCPNPAIDHTMVLPRLSSGETVRAVASLTTAGGKGLNVARFARDFGVQVTAVTWLGAAGADLMFALAGRDGLNLTASIAPGLGVRVCPVLVCEADGSATVASDPPPVVDRATWADFVEMAAHAAREADVVCIAGSFPGVDGVDDLDPVGVLLAAVASAAPLWVDTSQAALARSAALANVSLKVNLAEACGLVEATVPREATERDRAMAAAEELGAGGRDAVVTAGRAGAASSTAAGLRWRDSPAVGARNPTASGDAFMAAYLCAGRAALSGIADPLWAGVLAGAVSARSWRPLADAESIIELSATVSKPSDPREAGRPRQARPGTQTRRRR